jgi:hypothetical protein
LGGSPPYPLLVPVRLFALAAALLAGPALAQDAPALRPGDPALDTARLATSTDSMAVYVVEGGQAFPIGRILLTTEISGDRLSRTEVFYGAEGEEVWTDTFTLDRGTLRPIRQRSLGPIAQELDFEGSAVRQGRGGEVAEASLPAPVFYANALDLILRALPLGEGYRARLAVLDEDALGERVLEVEVAGLSDAREVTGVVRGTWEVRVREGDAESVYHVDRGTGALIRHEAPADGLVLVRW